MKVGADEGRLRGRCGTMEVGDGEADTALGRLVSLPVRPLFLAARTKP